MTNPDHHVSLEVAQELAVCTQCGDCCKEQVCGIGENVFGCIAPPCKGLLFNGGKYWCGPVLADIKDGSMILHNRLGIGRGCCGVNAPDNAEEIIARMKKDDDALMLLKLEEGE